ERNGGNTEKRATGSSPRETAPRPADPCKCPHRSHFCPADDHVRGTCDCWPCPALCRAPPQEQGRQIPAATTGACTRPECANTARCPDAAAAHCETARAAYANQPARSDRKPRACTATTRGPPAA